MIVPLCNGLLAIQSILLSYWLAATHPAWGLWNKVRGVAVCAGAVYAFLNKNSMVPLTVQLTVLLCSTVYWIASDGTKRVDPAQAELKAE